MKKITGHLAEKNGQRYAVINLKSPEGKRQPKWINLNLEYKRNNEVEANRRLAEILEQYNSDEMYKMEGLSHSEREKIRIANMYIEDYMKEWLESYKINISVLTYDGYKKLIDNRITKYFKDKRIKVKELTGDDLNGFYVFLIQEGLKGATAQRHHSVLHRALKQAVKRGIIPSNPCEQADRPKADKYIGEYYNVGKLKALLESLEGDPMRVVVILTVFYGLRRSEVLGIKWNAIDWDSKMLQIKHKIIENKTSGKTVIEGHDVLKTKSSCRSYPLMHHYRALLPRNIKSHSAWLSVAAFAISVIAFLLNDTFLQSNEYTEYLKIGGMIFVSILLVYAVFLMLNASIFQIFGKDELYKRLEASITEIYINTPDEKTSIEV